jgi:hypothetical protein
MATSVDKSLIGKRVCLVRCSDPYTSLRAGDEGTVESVDSFGTVHVSWDNGSSLGLIKDDGDMFTVLEESR